MKLKQKGLRKKFLTKRKKKNSDSGSITSPEVDLTLEGNNASVFFDLPIKNDLEGDSGASMTMSPRSPGSPDPDCLTPVAVTDDSGTEDQVQEISQMFADLIKEVENGNSTDSTLIGDQSLVSSGHVSPVSDQELEKLEMEDEFMEYKGPTIKSFYQRNWNSSFVCSCDPSSVCKMDVIIKHVHISPGKPDDQVDCVQILGTYLVKILSIKNKKSTTYNNNDSLFYTGQN
ncbi:hypothetical protein LOTGIDRAFT_169844 [Lottia gigantea]|uniref:Uncharacterized protein n=1 Tax=Lottia gigantea TaxID=225164 RepID=V3YWV0_LOTGI|nr:hypothetical protein LOTGIDRAFT_169844 [Lottia gigantea]ESO82523.1 hypothetical protein LOTGIDRAFT_169844 [Lottia gigantea]